MKKAKRRVRQKINRELQKLKGKQKINKRLKQVLRRRKRKKKKTSAYQKMLIDMHQCLVRAGKKGGGVSMKDVERALT
jgi:DNA-binding transcriptional regulator GbsR (MarR family)